MKRVPIAVGLVLAFVVGAFAIALLSARPGVSLTLVEYKKWPHGAMVRLTNRTQTTIRYLAEHNDLFLRVQKTSNGWTTASTALSSVMFPDPRTGKTNEYFFPDVTRRLGEGVASVSARELKPGRSAEFWVWLEPGASPIRVGTICFVPQNQLMKTLRPSLDRIKRWCRIKTTLPGQMEVWCPTPLYMPSSARPANTN